jgi:DNA polymerase III subunit gamma/tau
MVSSGRVPKTILLAGPYSSGKTTLARLLPLYLNCEQLTDDGEPCRKCFSCRGMRDVILGSGEHPDVTEIDAASNRGIDDIRELKKLVQFAAVTGHRVFIIDECQQLTPQAWQAALKIFEEAPDGVHFVIVTTEPEKVPKTINSRSRRYNLNKITPLQTSKLLLRVAKREGVKIPKSMRQQIAGSVDGHPRDALQILEEVIDVAATYGKKKGFSLKKQFPSILAQSNTYKAYKAAQDYVTAVFAGDLVEAIRAINGADNLTFFTNQVILIYRTLLHGWLDRSLVDRSKYWAVKGVQALPAAVAKKNLSTLFSVLDNLVEAQVGIKQYLADPHAILEVRTYKTMTALKSVQGG